MSDPLKAGKLLDFDESNGEIRSLGRRFELVDVVGLCRHLDMLVGEKVAASIVGSYGRESGREDLANLRKNNPNLTLKELIAAFSLSDLLGGYGVSEVSMREDEDVPIELEIRNPIIQASTGTAVKFVLSYWIGGLSDILEKTLEISHNSYDPKENVLRCRLAVIGVPATP